MDLDQTYLRVNVGLTQAELGAYATARGFTGLGGGLLMRKMVSLWGETRYTLYANVMAIFYLLFVK